MQIRQALQQGLKTLNEHQVPSAPLAAELLLMHALDCDRAHLHAHPERNLSRSLADRYFDGITERASGKPTQYIVGHQEFWGLDFLVDTDVLIPRPETEHLIEAVLELIDLEGIVKNGRMRQDTFHMIDVGTGSGCIALALAHELPHADVVACDISPKALRVAERNAARLGLSERVTLMESDLLARFLTTEQIGPWDFIVSNPPYVSRQELDGLQREVRDFEPPIALSELEGSDAIEIYRRLIPQAHKLLRPSGYLIMEIGSGMERQILQLFEPEWENVQIRRDLQGLSRVIIARKIARKPTTEPLPH